MAQVNSWRFLVSAVTAWVSSSCPSALELDCTSCHLWGDLTFGKLLLVGVTQGSVSGNLVSLSSIEMHVAGQMQINSSFVAASDVVLSAGCTSCSISLVFRPSAAAECSSTVIQAGRHVQLSGTLSLSSDRSITLVADGSNTGGHLTARQQQRQPHCSDWPEPNEGARSMVQLQSSASSVVAAGTGAASPSETLCTTCPMSSAEKWSVS